VGFPWRPRRRQRGARQREGSGEEVGQCSGLEAATGGEEAIGAVELNGEGEEEGVRRRQELAGEEGNDGVVVPVEIRPRGVAWECQ
jgi:hypothetical protein